MNADDFDIDLGDPGVAAVYLLGGDDADALDELDARARDSDALVLRVGLQDCRDKGELLRRMAATFDLPDTFGNNWDALSDSLCDLEWLQASGYVLLIDHSGDLRETSEAEFDTLVEILEEVAASWRDRDVAFFSFIDLSTGA